MTQHIQWYKAEKPYILNLSVDEQFKPIKNGIELDYKVSTFPGGEPHFQILNIPQYRGKLIITQKYNKIDDFFNIILAVDAARRIGFQDIDLILPYFPSARQDRVCNEGEPLTVKVFAEAINALKLTSVVIFCPHSEVTPALLNNVHVIDELDYVQKVVNENLNGHNFNIICPDAGAGKRTEKIVKHLSKNNGFVNFNLIRCEKIRDVKDGSLKDFFVHADDLGGHPTLIVDDINCYGGTFIGLGKKLREKNCGELMLFTAHVDLEKGVENIANNFDKYYTTNSKVIMDGGKYPNVTIMNFEL